MVALVLTQVTALALYLTHEHQALLSHPVPRAWRWVAAGTGLGALGLWSAKLGVVAGVVAWSVALMLGLVLCPLLVVHARGLSVQRNRSRV